MKTTKAERLLSFLWDWSIKTGLPLLLYLAFLPGFTLCAVFLEIPFGFLGLVIILTIELWELKALDDLDGKLSEVFTPILVMFPYVCASGHFVCMLYNWIQPNAYMVLTDKSLIHIWIIYVTAASIGIVFCRTKKWLKWHRRR